MGEQSCLRRAREAVFWPGLNATTKTPVEQCEICQERSRVQPKEPLINHPLPQCPWQTIGCDWFSQDGLDYLVTVDYNSDFFEVDRLYFTGAATVILKLKTYFARYGIPNKLITDGHLTQQQWVDLLSTMNSTMNFHPCVFPRATGELRVQSRSLRLSWRKSKRMDKTYFFVFAGLQEYSNRGHRWVTCTVSNAETYTYSTPCYFDYVGA